MLIQKICYSWTRLMSELNGKEDYWHVRLKPYCGDASPYEEVYYLDMSPKADYAGDFQDGLPIFYYNGKYPVFLYVTILNYALGLLNRKHQGENVDQKLHDVVEYLVRTQLPDGTWRHTFPKEVNSVLDGKASGMVQGLAISFLIRASRMALIDQDCCRQIITKAYQVLLSDEFVTTINGRRLIEKIYNPGTSVLNGALFALLGVYDYNRYVGKFDDFNALFADLVALLPMYDFHGWSYYDAHKMICSGFYQQLHVDLLDVFYILTERSEINYWRQRWRRQRWRSYFILRKALQKGLHWQGMVMNASSRIE